MHVSILRWDRNFPQHWSEANTTPSMGIHPEIRYLSLSCCHVLIRDIGRSLKEFIWSPSKRWHPPMAVCGGPSIPWPQACMLVHHQSYVSQWTQMYSYKSTSQYKILMFNNKSNKLHKWKDYANSCVNEMWNPIIMIEIHHCTDSYTNNNWKSTPDPWKHSTLL